MTTVELNVGTLVIDEAIAPSPDCVQIVVGFRDDRCLTSYVAPPPWMELAGPGTFFVFEPERLRPAPPEIVAELEESIGHASPLAKADDAEADPDAPPTTAWLDELERLARHPVIEGQEDEYCGRLALMFPRTRRSWGEHSQRNRKVLADIVSADPSREPRVAELSEEEIQLIRRFLDLWKRAVRLRDEAPGAGRLPETRAFREQVLRWIHAVRAHERDVTGALLEVYYRDRGGQSGV